jgi:hypothetical protein
MMQLKVRIRKKRQQGIFSWEIFSLHMKKTDGGQYFGAQEKRVPGTSLKNVSSLSDSRQETQGLKKRINRSDLG